MANGGDRVLRITGEGHHRLRNDHEQFLEAYESEFGEGIERDCFVIEVLAWSCPSECL